MVRAFACAGLAWLALAGAAMAAVQVDPFIRREEFSELKLSPAGDYLAATLPLEDRTALVILRLSDLKPVSSFSLGRNTDIAWFDWANDRRVLLGVADKIGMLAEPQPTGEVMALDVESGRPEMMVGWRVDDGGAGTRIKRKTAEAVWAQLADPLPHDPNYVILNVGPFSLDAYTRAERMDVRHGRRTVVGRVPVRNAGFVADHQGVVRAAEGSNSDNASQLYYRASADAEWELLNGEASTGRRETPLGFSADGRILYLYTTMPEGPDAIVAFDVQSRERREVLRDAKVDPERVIHATTGPREPIGVRLMDGVPRVAFFREDHPDARLYRMLGEAFAGESVELVTRSADGRLALVQVSSDRNPGDFYLFDANSMNARYLVSRRGWLDPKQMAPRRPVAFAARDGLQLQGYLTAPAGDGRKLPLVLLPHGGPYGIQDTWFFEEEAQMLAAAGYAVLQVNFRGSGGYGRAFREAGARQWGLAMQDDLTDATRWAIAEGIADPRRICIYGASYGAYAALMGAAREPDLYRCAAGYVGVYDLPMRARALAGLAGSGETWSEEWMGTDMTVLAQNSPVNLASRIKVPVLLAAGGQDERTPPEHTRKMERALQQAGVPVEAIYYPTEGHGFFLPANRKEYYGRLLAFLESHLGPGQAP